MFCYLALLVMLTIIGKTIGLGWPYWLGITVAASISLYHYTLIRHRDRAQCFKAFVHNNWLGAAVFAGLAMDYAIR